MILNNITMKYADKLLLIPEDRYKRLNEAYNESVKKRTTEKPEQQTDVTVTDCIKLELKNKQPLHLLLLTLK